MYILIVFYARVWLHVIILFLFYPIFLSILSILNIFDSYFKPILIHYLMLQENKIHLK